MRSASRRCARSTRAASGSQRPVQAATVQKLEDIILTRARDLRRSAVAN